MTHEERARNLVEVFIAGGQDEEFEIAAIANALHTVERETWKKANVPSYVRDTALRVYCEGDNISWRMTQQSTDGFVNRLGELVDQELKESENVGFVVAKLFSMGDTILQLAGMSDADIAAALREAADEIENRATSSTSNAGDLH